MSEVMSVRDVTKRFAATTVLDAVSVDFRAGVPDLTSLPRRDWAWALRGACLAATPAELDYGDPRGVESLRALIPHLERKSDRSWR